MKLWQIDPADRTHVRLDTGALSFQATPDRPGVDTMKLYQDDNESVCIERWKPNANIDLTVSGGAEFLLLNGEFAESGEQFEAHPGHACPRARR